ASMAWRIVFRSGCADTRSSQSHGAPALGTQGSARASRGSAAASSTGRATNRVDDLVSVRILVLITISKAARGERRTGRHGFKARRRTSDARATARRAPRDRSDEERLLGKQTCACGRWAGARLFVHG